MKPRSLLALALSVLLTPSLPAGEPFERSALQTADGARIAAMRNPTTGALDAIFSNQLHYAHSNGVVDTKESFLDILVSGKTKYVGYDHLERTFTLPTPGIA